MAGELELKKILIKSGDRKIKLSGEDYNSNYYRADSIFGNIGNKTTAPVDSRLHEFTKGTKVVEDITVLVSDKEASQRDLRGFDIAAKEFGCSGFKEMKDSEAYKMFLQVNEDDFSTRETEKDGAIAFFDKKKSDGKIKMFSCEIKDGKEVFAIKDKNGEIHYYDKKGTEIK